MLKNLNRGISLLLACGFVFSLTGCENKEALSPVIGPDLAEPLVKPAVAKKAGLKVAWTYAVPVKPGERLKELTLLKDRLYGLSQQNYLVSMDASNLKPVYGWQMGPAGVTIMGLGLYEDKIFSIVSGDLVELDPQFGTRVASSRLGFAPVCPAQRNSSFFYVAASDLRLHVLKAENMVPTFEAAVGDDAQITSVLAGEDVVVVATAAGTVVGMTPGGPVQLWAFKAADAVNDPVVRDGRNLFFSSRDANIYCIDTERGKLIWKYQAAALLKESPTVIGGFVYQQVDGEGLLAIDKTTGRLAWQLPEGIDVLSSMPAKVFVFAKGDRLAVLNSNKPEKRSFVDLPGVSFYAPNVSGPEIYLADDFGRIVCLRPID